MIMNMKKNKKFQKEQTWPEQGYIRNYRVLQRFC